MKTARKSPGLHQKGDASGALGGWCGFVVLVVLVVLDMLSTRGAAASDDGPGRGSSTLIAGEC